MPTNTGVSGGVVELGGWKSSSIPTGVAGAHSSLWTLDIGATSVWKPGIDVPSKVRVSFFRMRMKEEKNDPKLKIEIRCSDKTETKFVDWVRVYAPQ